jgi:hypothetical protein
MRKRGGARRVRRARRSRRRGSDRRRRELHDPERLQLQERDDHVLCGEPHRLGEDADRRLSVHERQHEPVDRRERERAQSLFLHGARHSRDEGFVIDHARPSLPAIVHPDPLLR